jgi:DNA-binding transcriptional MerR regulator
MPAAKRKKPVLLDDLEIDDALPVYTTGVVCRLLDVPVWILKQLDKEGIVSPDRKTQGESRLYSKEQLKEVQECWYFMKEHRVNVHGVRVILQIRRGEFTARGN